MPMLLVDQLLGVLEPIAELSVILPATSLFVNSQLVLFDIVMGNKAGSPKKQCSNPV